MKTIPPILFFCLSTLSLSGQGAVSGVVRNGAQALPYAAVYLRDTDYGAYAGPDGVFQIEGPAPGEYTLAVRMVGYRELEMPVVVKEGEGEWLEIDLSDHSWDLETVVVSGSRSFHRRTESPVIVQVLNRKTLESVAANALSEGLCFQPGLRMEVNCQTCNYTQLRMNGLGGAYSQILVNSRPIFGSLVGLYGLEQMPAQLIERVEVVRGGGSALYGSSAVGGTVNIITRRPAENLHDLSVQASSIGGRAAELWVQGMVSMAGQEGRNGIHLAVSRRDREHYDHNGDGFSELPRLENTAISIQSFFDIAPRHEVEIFYTRLEEQRRGGDQLSRPPHLAQQAEERKQQANMGGAAYRWKWKEDRGEMSVYGAFQQVSRTHYTGIMPDDSLEYWQHLAMPPYGDSRNTTGQLGWQAVWRTGRHTLTGGAEYLGEAVLDRIEAYDYLVDQRTRNLGVFLQSEWRLPLSLTLLTGIRADRHNLVEGWVANPRVSLLHRMGEEGQLRASWSTGFRAPQAFDADLHIALAGGGIQRILLAPGLAPERSNSWSASFNYDKPGETQIYGFTLEGFYTRLSDAFVIEEREGDTPGLSVLEKRNGGGTAVAGATVEVRWNYNQRVQWESGLTLQRSRYDEPVAWSAQAEATREYLRTPNLYGYHVLSFTPESPFRFSWSGVLTGPMWAPRFGFSENDQLVRTETFWENNFRISYTFELPRLGNRLELSGGVQNALNAYQSDFDSGKYRDSNYIYGPARPRAWFLGVRLKT